LYKSSGFNSRQDAQPDPEASEEANDFRVGVEALRRSNAEDDQPWRAVQAGAFQVPETAHCEAGANQKRGHIAI